MKNTLKRLAAFTAATLITAALAVPVFAEDPAKNSWVEDPEQNGMMDFAGNKVPHFYKKLTIYNAEEVKAYVPEVKYTYNIKPANPEGKTITDKNGNQAIVKEGVPGGFALISEEKKDDPDTPDVNESYVNEFSFTFESNPAELKKAEGATLASDTLTRRIEVAYNANAFTSAGVYRYELTESSQNYKDYGITRSADTVTRYVDVYVQEKDGTTGQFEVYGAVMFYDIEANDDVTVETVKTDGFTDSGDPTGEGSTTSSGGFTPDAELKTDPSTYKGDALYTYNYLVKKDVKNSLLGNEEFPFTVTVTSGNTEAIQYFNYSTAGFTSESEMVTQAAAKGEVNAKTAPEIGLADGKYLALTAVPANVSIKVSEKNDEPAVYDVTASDETKGDLTLTADRIKTGESAGFAAIALTNYAEDTTAIPTAALTKTLFTNKMENISPTGLFFTVAPFAAMAGLGAGMIVLFAKNKKRDDAENII